MNNTLFWIVSQLGRRLWLRATFFCLIGIATALLGVLLKDHLPAGLSYRIGANSVDGILTIIASSMLAVTTFSLSIMVSAYTAASSSATPRVTELLLSDSTSQNALSVFIGAFLFSLAGIITLKIGIYGDNGRLVLFVVTIAVVLSIVMMLLRWISHLSHLGRIGHTIDMVESQTRATFKRYLDRPLMGCLPLPQVLPARAAPLPCDRVGYIENIDTGHLQKVAQAQGIDIFLMARPGSFSDGVHPVIYTSTPVDENTAGAILSAIAIDGARSFTQDPRYCMIVLSEISSRALSPAVNDPGTAIDVIGTQLRLLTPLAQTPQITEAEDTYDNVYAPAIDMQDIVNDAFMATARDGAALFEVCMRLQKALAVLAQSKNADLAQSARNAAKDALALATQAIVLDGQRDAIAKACPA